LSYYEDQTDCIGVDHLISVDGRSSFTVPAKAAAQMQFCLPPASSAQTPEPELSISWLADKPSLDHQYHRLPSCLATI
jgi:hypothetical protein